MSNEKSESKKNSQMINIGKWLPDKLANRIRSKSVQREVSIEHIVFSKVEYVAFFFKWSFMTLKQDNLT